MLIQSKFKDYYDQCASFGVDMKIQYHRVSLELKRTHETGPDGTLIKAINAVIKTAREKLTPTHRDVDFFYIGFCGKIYVGLTGNVLPKTGELQTSGYYSPKLKMGFETKYFWDARDFFEKDLKKTLNTRSWMYLDCRNNPDAVKTLGQWLEHNEGLRVTEALELFTDHKLVAFVLENDTITLNPCLKKYGFQRIVGGVDAFQSIDMFISGVLGQPAKPMIELADKDRIQAHGFDSKSFRKEPTKRS